MFSVHMALTVEMNEHLMLKAKLEKDVGSVILLGSLQYNLRTQMSSKGICDYKRYVPTAANE